MEATPKTKKENKTVFCKYFAAYKEKTSLHRSAKYTARSCPLIEQLVLYCMCWNTGRMCDVPTLIGSRCKTQKQRKGFHPKLAHALSAGFYISMGNIHTPHISTLISLCTESWQVQARRTSSDVCCWCVLSPCMPVPMQRVKLWKSCQVQDRESPAVHWQKRKKIRMH